jgi:short-subunit dehydrogenase
MKEKKCSVYSGSKDAVENWINNLLKNGKNFATPIPSTCVVDGKVLFNVVIIYE